MMAERITMTTFTTTKVVQVIARFPGVSAADKERYEAEVKRDKTFSLMACGLTGTGKSTLLNGIAGEEFFVVADYIPVTIEVDKNIKQVENCKLVLYDTPGFQDDSGEEDVYLEKIKKECANVDTLFYCISVAPTRIKMKEDLATLKMLKDGLDDKIWKNCIIVLTLANAIVERLQAKGIYEDDKIKEGFKSGLKTWEEKVTATIKKAGIDPTNIPIVYAGTPMKRYLLKNDSEPWLTTFFHAVRETSSPDGQAVLHHCNLGRFQDQNPKKDEEKNPPKLHAQTIVATETMKKSNLDRLKARFPTIAGAIATGGVAGGAGAGIGATIGALAIGIPSFGTAAWVGLCLGGLIGGGIGISVGAVGGKVVEKIRDHRKKGAYSALNTEDNVETETKELIQ